jgi:putative transposase
MRHAVWLYMRFTLSYRDVEDLLAERGLDISYETVRRWLLKLAPLFARELRRRRPRPTSRRHLDEMPVPIAGRQFGLWRAVDEEGEVLDLLVQRRRDKAAAVKLMRKLLKKQSFAPDVLVTDKLRSYGAAKSEIGLSARHEQGLRKNNRAENSHERKMQRFKIARISSTLLVYSRLRPKHVQRPAASHIPPHAPPLPRRSFPDVASCYRSLNLSLGLPIFALAKFGSRENAPWRTGRRRQPTTYQGHGDGYQSRSKNRTLWGYCPERAAWGGFKLIRVAQARAFVHSRF